MAEYQRLKADLYQSFLDSNSRGFTDGQVDLAKRCIDLARNRLQLSGADTYDAIPFIKILQDNDLAYARINVALNLVLQYITNLLAEDLPPNWWSISTKTAAYAFRLARVKGAEDILRQAGYTRKSGDFLSFPEDKRNINKGLLASLATEVLLARVDCEGISDKRWGPPFEVGGGTSTASLSSSHPSLSYSQRPAQSYTQPVTPSTYGDHGHNRGGTSGYGLAPPSRDETMPSLDQTPRPRNPAHQGRDRYGPPSPQGRQPHGSSDDRHDPRRGPGHSEFGDRRSDRGGPGYDTRGPGYDNRGSGYDTRGSGYDNRGSGYDNRGPGYNTGAFDRGSDQGNRGFQHDDKMLHDTGGWERTLDRPPQSNSPSSHDNRPRPSSEEKRPQPAPRIPRQTAPVQLKPNLDVSSSTGFTSAMSEHSSYASSTNSFTRQPDPRQRPEPSTDRHPHEDSPTHSGTLLPSSSDPSNAPPHHRSSGEQPVRSSSRTSGELSGGSHHSSPASSRPQSSNHSGTQTSSAGTGPLPDEPKSVSQASNRVSKLQKLLEMAKDISQESREDPPSGSGIYTTPINQQPTNPPPTSLATPTQSSFDEQPPKPKPRKARTSASPAAPPTRSGIGFRKQLSGVSEEEPPPASKGPLSCTKCNSFLRDGVCPYCKEEKPPLNRPRSNDTPFTPPQRQHEEHQSQAAAVAWRENEERRRKEQLDEHAARLMEQAKEKNFAEVQHFKSLTLTQQQDYLDDKVRNKESYGHLKPHWHGRMPYKEREQEVNWFESLSSSQQQGFIQDKMEAGLDVSRFQNSLKAGVTLDMTDNINAFHEPESLVEIEQKREKVRKDGEHFVYWLRECSKYGFHPKEVEIAIAKHSGDPLTYLKRQWQDLIGRFIEMADLYKDENYHYYGKPNENEARLFLIEGKGDVRHSVKLCIKSRKEKIQQLEDKIKGRLEVSRDTILHALCRCNMVVEEAYYSLQRDTLNELYTYMTTDYSEITQGVAELEFLKNRIVERIESDDEKSSQACIRMIMAECRFKSLAKAGVLRQLLKDGHDYPLKYYIDACNNYSTYEEAKRFLNQSCPICIMDYPMDEMVVMPACGDAICKECFMAHFTLVIKEQSVKHFTCPVCNEPDLSNPDQTQTMNLELFVGMVKAHLDEKTYQLCQQKLTDFNLSKEEGFVWCPNDNCRAGFINDNKDRYDIQCVNCNQRMCFQCKRPWEEQHKGISCEQFAKWKADNDPEAQKAGLAAHLNENGIQCPQCKFRYALARGGCMHFRCTQCPNEFCSGCGGSMKLGDKCGRFESCKKLGLHAHHPRDCLFYIRDFSVPQLQEILQNNKVEFDTEPSKNQIEATRNKLKEDQNKDKPLEEQNKDQPLEEQVVVENIEGEEPVAEQPVAEELPEDIKLTCCVMLQKETPEGLKDEECGKDALKGMAGLCETHYKEYLVSKINENAVDPIELYELHHVKMMLKREEMEVPPQNEDENETDADYRLRLIEHIKKELPLDRQAPPELPQ